jgi:hypothetical protein
MTAMLRAKLSTHVPSDDVTSPEIESLPDGTFQWRLNNNDLEIVRQVMTLQSEAYSDLHFHLHNLLCVAIWSAFEGYVQGSLAEIFTENSELLASEKKITVAEVIAAPDIVGYLVAKEIDEVGRRGFEDLQGYIRSKLKVQFSNEYVCRMQNAYFLRNVIAHSAGLLRKDQLPLVPQGVDVRDDELRLSQKYLVETINCIESAVFAFHRELAKKYSIALETLQKECERYEEKLMAQPEAGGSIEARLGVAHSDVSQSIRPCGGRRLTHLWFWGHNTDFRKTTRARVEFSQPE